MGRKFSFGLAPIKVPPKPEKLPEPSPSVVKTPPRSRQSHAHAHAHSHSQSQSHTKDSFDSPPRTYVNRQRLDPTTEQELRAACALILQDFKPSDHGIADADPKLDFRVPQARREQRSDSSQVRVRKPTGVPAQHSSYHDAARHVHGVESASQSYPDLATKANTGRRRIDFTQLEDVDLHHRRPLKSPSTDNPRQMLIRADTDADDNQSVQTPLTASTDPHMYNGSTAPTSVAVTHRSSKRTSRQMGDPAAVADAQAAEWMRQELEKRRHHVHSQPRPGSQASERPLSRGASIRSGIREYMFPGSRNLSRKPSHDSLRSQSSGQPKRSSSVQGWRSWGLNRMSSSRSSSRPGTSGGRTERSEPEKKGELNLNRELPPLPSLDTWKEPSRPKEPSKMNTQGAHIATVMRTQDQQQAYAAAARQHHKRTGSESQANGHKSPHRPTPSRTKSQAVAQKVAAMPESRSYSFDHVNFSTTQNLDDRLKLRVQGHAAQHSGSTASRISSDGRLHAPNFSRKMSSDDRPFDATEVAYPNTVQVTATNAPKQESKSKLRKVISGWMLKKDRKDDWMQKFEKEGIRTGVMMQDEAALAPVVRY